MKQKSIFFLLLVPFFGVSQKQIMTPEVYDNWNYMKYIELSSEGDYLKYHLEKEQGDHQLVLCNMESLEKTVFHRAAKSRFSEDGQYIIFHTKPAYDSIRQLKRNKTPQDEFPKDSLFIYDIAKQQVQKIPEVDFYTMPEKWEGVVAYNTYRSTETKDSTGTIKNEKDFLTIIRDLSDGKEDTLTRVENMTWHDELHVALYTRSGTDSTKQYGVYEYNVDEKAEKAIFENLGNYYSPSYDTAGNQVCFIADTSSGEEAIRSFALHYYNKLNGRTEVIFPRGSILGIDSMQLSINRKCAFSDNGKRVIFGVSQVRKEEKDSLLEDEKVVLEVWNTDDEKIFSQMLKEKSTEDNRTYLSYYDLTDRSLISLATQDRQHARIANKNSGRFALLSDSQKGHKAYTWTGKSVQQAFILDLDNKKEVKIAEDFVGFIRLSPKGEFVFAYSYVDSSYYLFDCETTKKKKLVAKNFRPFNELDDRPTEPGPYGVMGWSDNDEHMYIYDRYDIWMVNPRKPSSIKRITNGRKTKTRYRYVRLNKEISHVPNLVYLNIFQETTREAGYATLDLQTGKLTHLVQSPHNYSQLQKAKNANVYSFRKGDFKTYTDVHVSGNDFSRIKRVSDGNPQTKDYAIGSSKIVTWESFTGKKLEGILITPANFDTSRKYPMIVNFYERSSHQLHYHRAPYAHRSTINASYYASKGYIVFIPDVVYTKGNPGQNAFDCVISGVEFLIDQGFVDKDRIGAQGHSWGGYQVAHLLTMTDVFACAEAGAPVVNMTSAYGGIRKRSGISRMFQYEKTQSRIGENLWKDREAYIRNSPLFFIDKVTTPVLILHNDEDGAVPYSQGIEYYMALRRLDKKAWLLNYNGEPHWPQKYVNRRDFQVKMEEFFGHYLMEEPMPEWMKKK